MGGIAIFAVHDPRLRGTEQVTAAHEMLHAAYERLSSGERHEVDAQLVAFFESGALDAEVRERIESYEPSARVSEMHSMLGTEVAQLPAGLETYYRRYFDDRSAVTSFAAAYREQFQRLESQIDTYEARLHTWSAQLETRSEDLDRQEQQLAVDRARLDSLRASSMVDEYNAAVPAFNASVGAYNLAFADFHAQVDAYNNLVHQRNAIAQALGDLSRELDTRLAP
jgi:chromosome segregation ATPase